MNQQPNNQTNQFGQQPQQPNMMANQTQPSLFSNLQINQPNQQVVKPNQQMAAP